MNIRLKGFAAIGFAVIILSSVALHYYTRMWQCYEMTFLSNAISGTVLLIGGITMLCAGRDLPQWLYLDCAVLLVTVIFVCGIFAPVVCFGNASVVLHLINPILMSVFYLAFCKAPRGSLLFTALVFPVMYYVFMILFGVKTGAPVYIYFDTNAMSKTAIVLYGVAASLAVLLFGAAFIYFNRFLSKRLTALTTPRAK